MSKTLKLRKEGRVCGPYDRVPFPNSWCQRQAIVCRTFSIPKNPLTPEDGLIRIINHMSYPTGLSINSLTPREDSGEPYYMFTKFLHKIAWAGAGCLFFLADVESAYKLIFLDPDEWANQCYKVNGQCWFDKTAVFGASIAGDHWNKVMTVIQEILRVRGRLPQLDVYVDNIDNVFHSSVRLQDANEFFQRFLCLCKVLNLPLHDIHPPTHSGLPFRMGSRHKTIHCLD